MLIMILAYTQNSGNNSLIYNHYGLLQKWGQYLKQNALAPTNQWVTSLLQIYERITSCCDNRRWADYLVMQNNLPMNNQTNLALKGIIAIAAMSRIATIAGNSNDASQFIVRTRYFDSSFIKPVYDYTETEYSIVVHPNMARECVKLVASRFFLR